MLQVGQKLWFVSNQSRRDECEVEIYKIGRKWAYIDYCRRRDGQYRVDLETLEVDGGQYNSPGQCYLSKEAWEDVRDTGLALRVLRGIMTEWSYSRPRPGVTKADIAEAARLLKMGDRFDHDMAQMKAKGGRP